MAIACALPSPSALAESRASSSRQQPPARHGVGLLPLSTPTPAAPLQCRAQRAGAYCHMIARNVVAMSAGESVATTTTTTMTVVAPEEPVATVVVTGEAPAEGTIDLPEIVKTIQQAWDKVEDKYGVSSLAFAGAVALWGTAGMISAIDRIPLVPGALEIVGIGFTGWFTYKNLFFKSDREAVIGKAKSIYNDIIGGS